MKASAGKVCEERLVEAARAVARGDMSRDDFKEMQRTYEYIARREADGLPPLDYRY